VDEPRTAPPPDPPADAVPDDPALWPADVTWRRVSPKLLILRRIAVSGWLIPVAVATVVVVNLSDERWLWIAVPLAGLALLGWWLRLVSRAVRSWGYAERADDLLIRRGVLIRRLTVVPYGRMQFVDVKAGPVERALGLATVQLHTAAAATDAYIPGLPTNEAARLRDLLTALGEARAAGL